MNKYAKKSVIFIGFFVLFTEKRIAQQRIAINGMVSCKIYLAFYVKILYDIW